jgi:molecular chaperone DnaK (HSP70)
MRARGLAWLGVSALLCCTALLSCGGESVAVPVEPGSPAIQDERLAEAVGIETVGGGFAVLLEAGCALPCESTTTYTTAADKPAELSLALFRGNERVASQNYFLGRYVVSEIAPVPRGVPQVELTVRADEAGLQLLARDPTGGSIRLRRLY